MSPKYSYLTLEKQINVIHQHENVVSACKLSAQFNCGKIQIGNIIHDKDIIIAKFYNGLNPKAKCLQPCQMPYKELDEKLFQWFSEACNLGYVVMGPLMLQQATRLSMELDLDDFQASHGWLASFKTWHHIKFSGFSRESADVPEDIVDDYITWLPDICAGYDLKDIFNVDESWLFYHQTQFKFLILAGEPCKGGKG